MVVSDVQLLDCAQTLVFDPDALVSYHDLEVGVLGLLVAAVSVDGRIHRDLVACHDVAGACVNEAVVADVAIVGIAGVGLVVVVGRRGVLAIVSVRGPVDESESLELHGDFPLLREFDGIVDQVKQHLQKFVHVIRDFVVVCCLADDEGELQLLIVRQFLELLLEQLDELPQRECLDSHELVAGRLKQALREGGAGLGRLHVVRRLRPKWVGVRLAQLPPAELHLQDELNNVIDLVLEVQRVYLEILGECVAIMQHELLLHRVDQEELRVQLLAELLRHLADDLHAVLEHLRDLVHLILRFQILEADRIPVLALPVAGDHPDLIGLSVGPPVLVVRHRINLDIDVFERQDLIVVLVLEQALHPVQLMYLFLNHLVERLFSVRFLGPKLVLYDFYLLWEVADDLIVGNADAFQDIYQVFFAPQIELLRAFLIYAVDLQLAQLGVP